MMTADAFVIGRGGRGEIPSRHYSERVRIRTSAPTRIDLAGGTIDIWPLGLLGFLLRFFDVRGVSLTTHAESPTTAGIAGSSALNIAVCAALNRWTAAGYGDEALLDVAQKAVGALALKLLPAKQVRLTGARPVDPEVYDLWLKGSYYSGRLTAADLNTAKRFFELALAKEPRSAPAYDATDEADDHVALLRAPPLVASPTPPVHVRPGRFAAALWAVPQ